MSVRVTQGDACVGFSCPGINPGSVHSGDSCDCPPGATGAQGPPGTPGPPGPPGSIWLDVTSYGASTNPLVDSTAAFQAALAAAAAGTEGTAWVLVPNVDVGAGEGFGIYSTVTIPANVRLFGVGGAAGSASLVYSFVPSGDPVFQFAAGLNRSALEDIQIIGPSGAPAGIAVSMTGSQFNYVANLQIWYHEIGIDFSDGVTPFSAYNLVEQCEVNLCTQVGIRALASSNANAIVGGRVFFTRNVGNTAVALQVISSRALSISGGLALEDYNVGLQVGGAPSFSMTGCWLEKGATLPLGADFEILSTFEESPLFEGGVLFDGNHHADPWPLSNGTWNVRQWGALPANADNSAALQAAIDYAADPVNGGVVYIPTGSYSFATALTNPACVPIVCAGELVYTGSGAHALTYGQAGLNTDAPSTIQSVINIRRSTQNWTDAFSGLRLLNVDELQAIVSAEDFECGILLQGDGTGTSYNQIQVQRLFGNRVGVRFHAVGIGWSNENTIRGGRYSSLQATSSALNMHGIEFVCDSTFSCNGNKIIGPSFELHNTGTGYTSAIHGEFTVGSVSGRNNVIENTRIESTDYWISGEGVRDNRISINFLGPNETIPADILNANTAADFLVLVQNLFDTNLVLAGSSDPIRYATFNKNNCIAVGSNLWRPARGVGWNRSTFSFLNAVAGAISDDTLTISSADPMGVVLDLRNVTRDYTRILTLKAIVRATGGRFAVVCWDAAGVRLTGADDCSLAFNGSVNYYRSGIDMSPDAAETVVSFGENVAFVFVGIATGTSAAQIEQFDVFGLGLADIRPLPGVADLNLLSAVPPNIGVYDIGDPISNVIPTEPESLPTPQPATLYPAGMVVRNISATTGTVSSWVYDGTSFIVMPTTVALGSSTVSGSMSIDKPDNGTADINLLSLGVQRWRLRENTSENFLVENFDAAGAQIGTPLTINNANGLATFGNSVAITTNLTMLASAAVVAIGDSAVAGNARVSFRKGAANNQTYFEWLNGTTSADSRWNEQFSSGTDRVGLIFDASGNLLSIRPYTFRYNVNNGRSGLALCRFWCDLGSTVVNGDVVASAGFGTGSAVAVTATGTPKDMRGEVQVTVGTTPGANPTLTLTFRDGTWNTIPFCTPQLVGGTGFVAGTITRVTQVRGLTTIVWTFIGTPNDGETYILSWMLMG